MQVEISAGRALKYWECTLVGQAWYVNVWVNVQDKGVDSGGVKFF